MYPDAFKILSNMLSIQILSMWFVLRVLKFTNSTQLLFLIIGFINSQFFYVTVRSENFR